MPPELDLLIESECASAMVYINSNSTQSSERRACHNKPGTDAHRTFPTISAGGLENVSQLKGSYVVMVRWQRNRLCAAMGELCWQSLLIRSIPPAIDYHSTRRGKSKQESGMAGIEI